VHGNSSKRCLLLNRAWREGWCRLAVCVAPSTGSRSLPAEPAVYWLGPPHWNKEEVALEIRIEYIVKYCVRIQEQFA
jgi:hypothetical protein